MAMKYSIKDMLGDTWEESPETLAYGYTLDFGDVVADLAKKNGMSFKQLAERAGMKPSNLSNILSGNANPTVKTMERIAVALGYSLASPRLEVLVKSNPPSKSNASEIISIASFDTAHANRANVL